MVRRNDVPGFLGCGAVWVESSVGALPYAENFHDLARAWTPKRRFEHCGTFPFPFPFGAGAFIRLFSHFCILLGSRFLPFDAEAPKL